MVVDGIWSFVGSVNWDPRSLQLNFEFNVEVYDTEFSDVLQQLTSDMIRAAAPVRVEALEARSLPSKLRDGVMRLFSPYL